ncbi:MAG: energy transducer TonB [Ferruginibacter sp.]
MRTEQILSADILDIIFDNRNKNYGAYDLRKFYDERLVKALGITFLLAGVVVFSFAFFKKDKALKIDVPETYIVKIYESVAPVAEPVKPKLPQPKATVKVASQNFVKNIVITKKEAEATVLAKNLDSVAISNITEAGDPTKKLLVNGAVPGKETVKAPVTNVVDVTTPRASAEVMPVFPGGMEGLRKFLQKNLENPEEMEQGQMVSVKIKFVVGYDGKLKSFETIEDGGRAFNNEVIRVLKRMPEWIPGKSNGENVSVYYTIPVKFTAAD